MRLLIFPSFSQPPLLRRGRPLVSQYRLRQWYPISFHSKRPPRFGGFSSKCSVVDVDVDASSIAMEDEISEDLTSCSNTLSPLASDIFYSASFELLKEDDCINSLLREVPVLTKDEQAALAATPAHPAGLYVKGFCPALYASFLVGNMVEQLWNFAWPTAVATLHTSLLPVAVVGFFAKLSVFIGAPLVGNLMDYFPRIPAYHSLNIIQTAAQLLSAAMIIHALSRASCTSASAMLFQPWFIVLVAVGAIERLAGLALGVTVEREWVVLLAGTNRPIALACANAMLNRIDLLCEIAGASIFGVLLSKYHTVTCLKLASGLMICALPVLFILGELINRSSSGALECSKFSQNSDNSFRVGSLLNMGKIVEIGFKSMRNGWMEYRNQPILPASLAYVFLYFNIALAPGSIMTAFLMHHGTIYRFSSLLKCDNFQLQLHRMELSKVYFILYCDIYCHCTSFSSSCASPPLLIPYQANFSGI
ncbi:hypothetical protein M5K25_009170 [Dendrobium thyrsiflorum]|uniref:Solute carrier family 40 member n=1 Tax=Dendrobium thyrsiflorum TaxID=117978 RepID=A0ABD0V624_DENTH